MSAIDQIAARAVEFRRDLHRHPELMHVEHRTAGAIRAALDRLGIRWRACAGTGTVATLAPQARGKRIALRADIDALPLDELTGLPYASVHQGVMHACGHDGHTASLVAAAEWLKSRESALPGPVTLLFQPAEEGGHGAKKMIDDGALAEVDEVYGWHNWPPLAFGKAACPAGPIMAANGEWDITITGRGGHASQPHLTVDPIAAGASFVAMVQQVVSRQISPNLAAVVSVTCFHAGTFDNIIPDEAKLVGTVRAATTQLRDELARRTEAVLHQVCGVSGAKAVFSYRPCYPATVNHPACAAKAEAALKRVLGEGGIDNALAPLMGAEDFSYYLQERPGAYVLLGSGRPGRTLEVCHSPRFDFDDELIPIAARFWAELVGVPV
jgi:hippurate hydrolase